MDEHTSGPAGSTHERLYAELLAERYGPPPLPPPRPPHPVQRALADRADPPAPPVRRRRHLVVLDGGPNSSTEAA
ncbi:hypothetical protein AB0873_14885 [Micromonospora sp. NPDC047707]|uniref:hypothetical protein n=1 Tax=Micromonospora sp. NPDC047707 TaxID=3154498 RepID=UPI003451972E